MLVSIPLFKKVQRGLDEVLGHTRENLDGARVIRAFNKQEEETKDFNESNAYLTKIQMLVGRISTLMNPLTYVIINFAIIAVIWVGGRQVDIGRISQGEVIALVNYMSQILVELVKLANLIITINKAIACGNRIQEVLEVVPTITDSVTETKKSASGELEVEFSHVSMKYAKNAQDSLTDINLKVKKGQTIGIIGGTGSGKSSVVNLIPRFYDVSQGSIKVAEPMCVSIRLRICGSALVLSCRKPYCFRERLHRICAGEIRMRQRNSCGMRLKWLRQRMW